MKVSVLEPHGFCAGVTGALRKALDAVRRKDAEGPLFCLHELVHNELVVQALKAKGMVFVESLGAVPDGARVLFSAHGVSPEVREEAERRGLKVLDATCPFVTRVHRAARAFAERGLPVAIIGHPGHAEVSGIQGEVPSAVIIPDLEAARRMAEKGAGAPLAVVSQTTMNADEVTAIVDALRQGFHVETMAEVCHATKERQDAVKAFEGDALLVLGSANSSNTRRLCEVAACRTFRAGSMGDLRAIDFSGVVHLGVTSGASTPEDFFGEVIRELEGK